MHNSKLIRLLRSLSKRQLGRFNEFVHSPYFNKNTEIISFYEYLLPFGPAFNHKKLTKKQVLVSFAGKSDLSEPTLAYWMNNLYQLLEQFLSHEKFKDDDLQIQKYLIQSFQEAHLPKAAQKTLEKAQKTLKTHVYKNADTFNTSYELSKIAYSLTDKNKRELNEELQKAANSLDIYYLVEKLRYCCEMLNAENIINVKYDLLLGNEIIRFLEGHPLAKIPAVAIYLNIVQMLKGPQGKLYFQKVKKLLIEQEQIFTPLELKELYTSLLNYCTRRINRFNEEQYWEEYLEINKVLLKKELLFKAGKLSPWRYTNLVHVGLKTNQTNWTKNFIEDFKKYLPAEYKQHMYTYNSGLFRYHLKNYDEAQQLLFNMESKDIFLNILNRSLLIKIYYETGQEELLLYSLEASRVFLIRNKLMDTKLKTQVKHFIEFTKKLVKIEPFEAAKLVTLQEKLPAASEVLHRDWLIAQIEKKRNELL